MTDRQKDTEIAEMTYVPSLRQDPSGQASRDSLGDVPISKPSLPIDNEVLPGLENEADVFPDGGTRAWLVVFGGFWTVFCGFGLAGSCGAFQSYYRTSLLSSYSESTIAWIVSAQAFSTFFPCIFTGALFDKYGHKPLIAAGGSMLTLGFIFLSLSTQYYQILLCHATLIAWGCNLLFICPIAVIGQWFDKRKGLAFGLNSTGSSLGSVVWPLVLANLPEKIGFGWTCRVLALISGLCGIASFFLLKTRLPSKPKQSYFFLAAFNNLEYNCVVVNFWTFTFGFFSYLTFIGTYGQLNGLGDFAPYLLIISNASSTFGRLGAGILADKLGVYNVCLLGNTVIAVMFWLWLACKNAPSMITLSVIIGLASGSFVSLQGPMATKTAPNMGVRGTMVGQAIFLQSFAQLICNPIFGAILGNGTIEQKANRFPFAIILAAAFMMIALASIAVARFCRIKRVMVKV